MANTDANKYPYTGQAEQNPYGGVSIENLVAVIAALLPKGGNNSSGQNIYAGVSPAGLADAVGLGNIQSNNSPAGNIYGGVSLAGILDALRLNQSTPDPKTAKDMRVAGKEVPASQGSSSIVSQIPTETTPVQIPVQVPEIANNIVDPSQLMQIEKGSYGPATETEGAKTEAGKTQPQPDQYQYSGSKPLRKDQEILDKYSSGDITASVVNGQLHLTNQGPGSLQRQTDQAKGAQLNAESISLDRKSTRLNSSHLKLSRMPSSA